MSNKELKALAQKMKGLDLCMLTTVTSYGHLGGRPMSNNGEISAVQQLMQEVAARSVE